MKKPIKTLDLEFTALEFYENFLISTFHENLVFGKKHVEEMTKICREFYGEKKFVYISHRKNNFNVNPTVYLSLRNTLYLSGIAVISERASSINIAYFEKNFTTLPFEIFLSKDDAIEWAEDLLKNKKADL